MEMLRWQLTSLLTVFFYITFPIYEAFADDLEPHQPYTIDDYFKYKRIIELSLSSDGEMIAYAVQSQSLKKNKAIREVYIRSTEPSAEPVFIKAIQDAQRLTWIPGKNELAFLSSRGGNTQVYSFNQISKKIRRYTKSNIKVVDFRFSNDGKAIAYIAQSRPNFDAKSYDESKYDTMYDEIQNGNAGVLIDPNTMNFYHFIDPNRPTGAVRPENQLWLKREQQQAVEISVPGRIEGFHWSSDGKRLSIVYLGNNLPKKHMFYKYTSIGVFDISTTTFAPIFRGRGPTKTAEGEMYRGGEWIPNSDTIHIWRKTVRDRSSQTAAWAIVDISPNSVKVEGAAWQEIKYIAAPNTVIPKDASNIYVKTTVNGVDALYKFLPEGGLRRADLFGDDVARSARHSQFGADFRLAVFVIEDLTTPPEIYVWREGRGVRRLTSLNNSISRKRMPMAKEITWKSRDGVTVRGWLLQPSTPLRGNKESWPLVTFVHGGPAIPYRNEFSFYFHGTDSSGFWPYPFLSYATNGIAVFIPNYRGTATFGNEFYQTEQQDGEPVYDIITGIDYLIGAGIADPTRLAISGHSHGGWLAPLVMTSSRRFRAGSFAEGVGNAIVMYEMLDGLTNRRTHDVLLSDGKSLYENPQRYIDLSPSLHFEGLETAVMFEAGAKSLAVMMLGFSKAAQFAGMPTEFVVYPQTGHNIVLPRLKKESAERNLDWFRFWLLDEEDPDPAKVEQYERWRKMRDEQETIE